METQTQQDVYAATPEISETEIRRMMSRFDLAVRTFNITDEGEKRELSHKLIADFVQAPIKAKASADALFALPFWNRLRWHAEGAVTNFGFFVVGGAITALVAQRIARRGASADVVGTEENPFESTASVEAAGRTGKHTGRDKAAHGLHAAH